MKGVTESGMVIHRKGQVRVPFIKGRLWMIGKTLDKIDRRLADIRESWDMGCLLTTPFWIYKSEAMPDWAAIIRESRFRWKLLKLTRNGWEVEDV